ncbi:MAG: superoxide dismutase [Woeseiaceae bacterium]
MNTLKRVNKCFIANRACLVLTLIMSFGVWNSAMAQSFPETVPLPDGFQPEGITLGIGHTAYVGSLAGGAIYAVDLRTGAGSILVPGLPGSLLAVGLDFDVRSGYLFVAGGLTGDGRVYDTDTGQMIHQVPLGAPWVSWINDVLVTRNAAYFTNSFAPFIYKVPLDSQGEPSGVVQTLMLGGDWQNFTNPAPTGLADMWINANGIVATPDNRTLIVVNYYSCLLYTVDPDTGFATEIDLGGVIVPTGDGLVLRGKTLYVVQNLLNAIAVFTMSPDFSTATLTGYLVDSDLNIPSTADSFGPWLYAVNARFLDCFPGPCPGLEYDIVRVDQ